MAFAEHEHVEAFRPRLERVRMLEGEVDETVARPDVVRLGLAPF